jgi:glycosyltransferase involved in cell wall biosynthesis
VKVLVLTTSYPPAGGSFVATMVELARDRGVDVEVVSPASFRHFGIAEGHGIVGNLRARPWLALLLPLFLWNFRRAAVARLGGVDLVHAHWLVSGAVAATLRRPYVVQVWGTDVELARRVPWLIRPWLRRVIAASAFLADEARALGAREIWIVPSPVRIPATVAEPGEGVLFAGRLSPEKGIEDFLAATEGLPRVVVGAGPVDVPESVGAVDDVGPYYERAAVVVVPSRREGYGMVAREAMAYGRPVVATAVGGLVDAIEDGVDGVLVPPRDVPALRAAVERLLREPELRERLGAEARNGAVSRAVAAETLLSAYRLILSGGDLD